MLVSYIALKKVDSRLKIVIGDVGQNFILCGGKTCEFYHFLNMYADTPQGRLPGSDDPEIIFSGSRGSSLIISPALFLKYSIAARIRKESILLLISPILDWRAKN